MKNDNKSLSSRKNINSKQRERMLCRRLLPALIAGCFTCGYVLANPQNATVVNGTASFAVSNSGTGVGNVLTVTNSNGAIINWKSFDIPGGHITNFVQSGPASAVLNRVTGNNVSDIKGTLQSGMMTPGGYQPGIGTIYLINPNGIVFDKGAQINVGGIVASTLNMTDAEFMGARKQFNKANNPNPNVAGSITNEATIQTPSGGQIYLIAPDVTNKGILNAPNGDILLAAGNSVTLVDSNSPDIHVVVSATGEDAVNLGSIVATSGTVGIYGALLNLTGGTINADKAVMGDSGRVVLKANTDINIGSEVSAIDGTLIANSSNGNITQSAKINVAELAAVAPKGRVTLTNTANTAGVIAGVAGGDGGFQYTSLGGTINVGVVGPYSGITSDGNIGLKAGTGVVINAPIKSNNTTALFTSTGDITETAAGNISSLFLSANAVAGNVYLTNPLNSVTTIAGNATSAFEFTNSKNMIVGTVDTIGTGDSAIPFQTGIKASSNNNAAIFLVSTGGSINTAAGAVIDSDQFLTLNAATGIGTQASPLSTSVNRLTATSNGGDIAISNRISNFGFFIDSIALNQSAGGGGIYVAGAGGFSTFIGLGVAGPITNNNTGPNSNIVLKANTGGMLISGPIVTKDTVALSSVAGIEQQGGHIMADGLSVSGTGTFNLNNPQNFVNTVAAGIAASPSASFSFTNAKDITVGKFNKIGTGVISGPAITGITASNAPVTLTSLNGSINTLPNVAISGGALTLNAANGIGSQGNPLNTSVNTLTAFNNVSGDIAISNTAKPLATGTVRQNGSGGIYIDTHGQSLTVNGPISATSGEIGLLAGNQGPGTSSITLNGPVSTNGILALESNGNITQGPSGTITANKFSARSHNGSVTLDNLNNDVVTANGIANAAGTFSLKDSNGYIVDAIASVGPGYPGGFFIPGVDLITLTIAGVSVPTTIVYNGMTDIAVSGGTVTGAPAGYQPVVTSTGTRANKNVGDVAVLLDSTVTAPFLFKLVQPDNLFTTVTPATLTINGQTAQTRTYDGTTNAAIVGGMLAGVIGSDDVMLNTATSGMFDNKNVGINKPVTLTTPNTIFGVDAMNYVLLQPTVTGTINPALLTINGQTAGTRAYDGTTNATITGGTLAGVFGGDNVMLNTATIGMFDTKNVGTNKPVSLITPNTIFGNDAFNYILVQPTVTGNITQALLTINGQTAGTRTYDGTTNATVTGGTLSGVFGEDNVLLSAATSGMFDTKNVGTNKLVTLNTPNTISGADALNYSLVQPTVTGDITAATLTILGQTAGTRTYDGTTNATVTGGTLSGVFGEDNVLLSAATSGMFDTKNVGTNKLVTLNTPNTISGADALNYSLVQPTVTGDITAATLTILGQTAGTRTYDGTTNATVTGGTLSGVFGEDNVLLSAATSGTFDTKNVGTNKSVTLATLNSISGDDALNYNLVQPTVTGNITPATLTILGQTAGTRTYDGTTNATVTGGTLSGVFGEDNVLLSAATSGTFDTKNVGTNKSVTLATLNSISGDDASNYNLVQPTVTGNITPATLTILGQTAGTKTYDGTTNVTVTGGTLSGVFGEDDVSLDAATSGLFDTKNVGQNKVVTLSELNSIFGADALNYNLVQSTTVTGNIVPKLVTISGQIAQDKTFDGTTTATLTNGAVSGLIAGDDAVLTQAGNFVSVDVGNNIQIIANNQINGADAFNYVLVQPGGLFANILPVLDTVVPPAIVPEQPVPPLVPQNFINGLNNVLLIPQGAVQNEIDNSISCS